MVLIEDVEISNKVVGGDSNLRKLEQEIEPPIGPLALVFTDIKNSTLLWIRTRHL